MEFKGNLLKECVFMDDKRLKKRFEEVGNLCKENFLPYFDSKLESKPYSLGMAYEEGYHMVNNFIEKEIIPYIFLRVSKKISKEKIVLEMKNLNSWDNIFDKSLMDHDYNPKGTEEEVERLENIIEDTVVCELREKIFFVIQDLYKVALKICEGN